jgi:membrane associated rhomboid family serine protease
MIPIPLGDRLLSRTAPAVTWTIVFLNFLIHLWDRKFAVFGSPLLFSDLAMRPAEVTLVFSGQGNPVEMAKIFTSLFLHADLLHLVMNMIYLAAFGPTVERTLGGWRFALFYLFWGIIASLAHTFVHPFSSAYLLGASGAIGGVMGMYLLLYPAQKIEIALLPFVVRGYTVPAWLLLGLWFIIQIALPQEGVANWAHVGGFAAGMLTVLTYGGREKALASLNRPGRLPEEAGP